MRGRQLKLLCPKEVQKDGDGPTADNIEKSHESEKELHIDARLRPYTHFQQDNINSIEDSGKQS